MLSDNLLSTRLGLLIGFAYLCALCVLGGLNILFFGSTAGKKALYH
jgi:hypothetical protein